MSSISTKLPSDDVDDIFTDSSAFDGEDASEYEMAYISLMRTPSSQSIITITAYKCKSLSLC